MTRRLASILFLALLFNAAPSVAHDHEHSHDDAAPQSLALKDGHKWATDDSLRQAMSGIRAVMAAGRPTGGEGGVSLQQYQALAGKVNEQIAFMVQNCKLDKEADAMLHLVLADLIAGAEAMAGRDGDKARQGAKQIAHALENYGAYFEHPGW